MAAHNSIAGFPNVENKLQAPTKKSLFERQRADAEAKRQREEAETQAVYEDFVKSFDDGEDSGNVSGAGNGTNTTSFGGAAKRHYTNSQGFRMTSGFYPGRVPGADRGRPTSGLGSLGPPPPGLNKKRTFEKMSSQHRPRDKRFDREEKGILAFDDYETNDSMSKKPFTLDNDEDEKRNEQEEDRSVPKPTVRLASLPPGTSLAAIKALIPSRLTVENVRILPPVGPGVCHERKSMSAIVTLAKDTAANDIDVAVNGLQNKYLGYGYYLNIHRHLSSAVLSNSETATTTGLGATLNSQPFGAKAVEVVAPNRGHAPPTYQGRFAPPSSYDSTSLGRTGPLLHVPIKAPQDIKELKLIHKVIEALLTHGPEFEALLMSRPDVQREEKWAWLWDARSTGATWYRWRLWEVLTGIQTRRGPGKYIPLFEGSSAWKQPSQPLLFEYTTRLEDFVSDSEYNSSSDENSGDESGRRPNYRNGGNNDISSLITDEKSYLNPLEKAKLTHLLARLPTTTGTLRKGDIARVTAFAISHAGQGADEVVQMIVMNVKRPFAYTSANKRWKKTRDNGVGSEEDEDSDTSAASLVGLYVISDILSSSSTSGVRHAWKYRQIFEVALKKYHVFEDLGRMERKMNWGRLRAEKWKRSVENILRLWEGWCVFPQESQESFTNFFDKPPLTEKEKREISSKECGEVSGEKGKSISKWKAVDTKVNSLEVNSEFNTDVLDEDIDGVSTNEDNLDGEPMADDDDLDGVPMEDEEPTIENDDIAPSKNTPPESNTDTRTQSAPMPLARPRRPRAVDMFADSDSDEA
ncbi:U2 snRNP-associated SURP motif-containing protein [Golovinomyces cichoracearum]|uniref:U2 snRNP-associated SURP motif-containing protein n=1 Tax=Golovinomyces cichoracearum TaxID=62708 RepID=A0A420INT9_9PEZI|nr:U2 snRNP-associated SURP motif-containing protein [Golovinomyces cichoracearum]